MAQKPQIMNQDERKQLINELMVEVGSRIEAKIETLLEPRLAAIDKALGIIQHSLDIIDDGLASDRPIVGDVRISMGTIKNEFAEMRDLFTKQTKTIVTKVEDKISEGVDNVAETIAETTGPTVEGVLDNFVAGQPKLGKKRKGLVTGVFSWLLLKLKLITHWF